MIRFIRFKLWWLRARPINDELLVELSNRIAMRIGTKPFKNIKESDVQFYNALVFGMSCRTVVVTSALRSLSIDYIEAVLLHEYAHCKFRHSIKIAFIAIALLSIVVGATIYILQFIESIIDVVLIITMFIAMYIIIQIILRYIARRYELEADLFAVSHASNPCSYLKLLMFLSQGEKSKRGVSSELFSAHPPAITRVETIITSFPQLVKCLE
ncbi:MAG: M48 family metalloprotease [Ignisphaera sp.]